jgi:hypothetical protein
MNQHQRQPPFQVGDRVTAAAWNRQTSQTDRLIAGVAIVRAVSPCDDCASGYMVTLSDAEGSWEVLDAGYLRAAKRHPDPIQRPDGAPTFDVREVRACRQCVSVFLRKCGVCEDPDAARGEVARRCLTAPDDG